MCRKTTNGGDISPFHNLAEIVVAASTANVSPASQALLRRAPRVSGRRFRRICLIGGSTGAVDAIERVLKRFPEDCPPTLITQHMPAPFLTSFSARLDPLVAPRVVLAEQGMELESGTVLIAPWRGFSPQRHVGAAVAR